VSEINYGSYIHVYGATETTYEVTFTLEMYGETALERFLGCVMIGMMPDQGLEEALYSLRDMLEFYRQKPVHLYGAQPKSETINATVVEWKKRPDLVITP
jgi:hypothetical protein